jgi:hypothetical protein
MIVYQFLLRMTSAAMTPGTYPQRVSRNTMSTDPHPRSITANGGKMMDWMTRKRDIGEKSFLDDFGYVIIFKF